MNWTPELHRKVEEFISSFVAEVKPKEEKLFTTLDGVDIYEGNWYFYITDSGIYRWTAHNDAPGKSCKYFSTREAAEEYILYSKPLLSLNDIIRCYKPEYHKADPLFKKILQAAKEKL